jgi:Ras-related protein Rab-1A
LTSYYKGTHGVLLVYDITDKQSFTDLQIWLNEVEKYGKQDVVKILIGNKKDLEDKRQVTTE